jgi:hypothetical protein
MNCIVAAHPKQQIHVILDNLNTHKPKTDPAFAMPIALHYFSLSFSFLLPILRFHFLHLLQELFQHRPRLRASALLKPIQRLSGRGRPIKSTRRANLDLQDLRELHQSIEVDSRIALPHQFKDRFAVFIIIPGKVSQKGRR